MFCVTVDKPEAWKNARIYVLSDLHIGDGNCDLHAISDRVAAIRDPINTGG